MCIRDSIQRLQLARIGEEEGVLLDLALVEPFRLDGAELGEKTHYLDAVPVSYTHLDVYKRQPTS